MGLIGAARAAPQRRLFLPFVCFFGKERKCFCGRWGKRVIFRGKKGTASFNDLSLYHRPASRGNTGGLFFGYYTDTDGLYEKLLPAALDVMAELSEGRAVFTHIYPQKIFLREKNGYRKQELSPGAFDFIKLPVFQKNHCVSDSSGSVIVQSLGIDAGLLRAFYLWPRHTAFENDVYVFPEVPFGMGLSYGKLAAELKNSCPRFVFSYNEFHVGLDIQIAGQTQWEDRAVSVIQRTCEKYCFPLDVNLFPEEG